MLQERCVTVAIWFNFGRKEDTVYHMAHRHHLVSFEVVQSERLSDIFHSRFRALFRESEGVSLLDGLDSSLVSEVVESRLRMLDEGTCE
jgi:hypothetical protein